MIELIEKKFIVVDGKEYLVLESVKIDYDDVIYVINMNGSNRLIRKLNKDFLIPEPKKFLCDVMVSAQEIINDQKEIIDDVNKLLPYFK